MDLVYIQALELILLQGDSSREIFKLFLEITRDSMIHFDNLNALFSTNDDSNKEILNAIKFGWKNASKKYKVVLVGECFEGPVKIVNELFSVNLE